MSFQPKQTFDLGKYIIAKLKKGKVSIEMIADPEAAWEAKRVITASEKKGKESVKLTRENVVKMTEIDLTGIFPRFDVFSNLKKAETPTEGEMMDVFGTKDPQLIAAQMILEGEFAWTKAQRDKWLDSKKKQIINILSRNSVNPQTKKPHPPQRIEKALEEAKISIDVNKSAEEQIDDIVKRIQAVLPIRIETINMSVKVPASYAAKAYNVVEKFAQVKQSEWQSDGSWVGLVSLPAGLQSEFLDNLNNLTHGKVQCKVITQ